MQRMLIRVQTAIVGFGTTFSFVGLAGAALFFAFSLTPSLLPRNFLVQGILSGFAVALGYGLGVLCVWTWRYMEIPPPGERLQWASKQITVVVVTLVTAIFLWRATVWQNSIRQLMEMEPVASAYPWRVGLIAILTALFWIALFRTLAWIWRWVDAKIKRLVPRRVSHVLTTLIVLLGLFLVTNHLLARLALNAADRLFLRLDQVIDEDIAQPKDPVQTGSSESLVPWESIGRFGKEFVAAGPTRESIQPFWDKEVLHPLRVYVGLASKETAPERARLALEELRRVGGFNRSVLVVATPTGTGWLDPAAVDSLEYLHGGDTAIVTMQYSYLPSWLTILVDPTRSQASAKYLFDAVYDHWKTLPHDSRPRLYVHGLSLGALGSAASADLFTVFEDPIQGGLWSGPPFPSVNWSRAVRYRNMGSTAWLPQFRDGSMLRFTGRDNSLPLGGVRWGPMRFVYIQHASDPMTFFSPDLLYRPPDWLREPRGPDVSPYLTWYPILTFLQTGFDLPMSTTVPHGFGHNFAASSYIDSWIEVTQPQGWSAEKTKPLKTMFAEREAYK